MDATTLFAPHGVRRPVAHFTTGDQSVTAVNPDMDAAVRSVARQHQHLMEYVRLSTWLIGVLPIIYGALTWIFGDDLWESSPIYHTALSVPYAPQSWGTTFIVLGVMSIMLAELKCHVMDAVCCMAMAVILASFMVAFLAEALGNHLIAALPPSAIYALFALLFMNRARLSWKFRGR